MRGRLEVDLGRNHGRTVITRLHQCAPLRMIRPFYPEDGGDPAHLYLMNTTGGVLEGDDLSVRVAVRRGGHVLLATPSATRIHRTPTGRSGQRVEIHLEAGAVLEYLPEPTLPFAESDFVQDVEVSVGEGAVLFYWDLLGPGRSGRGERFAYRRYESRLLIRDSAGPVVHDAMQLTPLAWPDFETGVMEGYTHLGSLYVVGTDENEGLLDSFREAVGEGVLWGTTLLHRRGVAVRALAPETPRLMALFTELWGRFRSHVLKRALPAVRRY